MSHNGAVDTYTVTGALTFRGVTRRYEDRVTATAVNFQNAYKIVRGETEQSSQRTFRTLAQQGGTTRFAIWNDTHENQATTRVYVQTVAVKRDKHSSRIAGRIRRRKIESTDQSE